MYVFGIFLSLNKATYFINIFINFFKKKINSRCALGESRLLLLFSFCTPFKTAQESPLFFCLREYIILYNRRSVLNECTLAVQEVLLFNAEEHVTVPCQKI